MHTYFDTATGKWKQPHQNYLDANPEPQADIFEDQKILACQIVSKVCWDMISGKRTEKIKAQAWMDNGTTDYPLSFNECMCILDISDVELMKKKLKQQISNRDGRQKPHTPPYIDDTLYKQEFEYDPQRLFC